MLKTLLQYFRIILFGKFYFVSGTFECNGEVKSFQLCYMPENGLICASEVKDMIEEEANYKSKFVTITNFIRISRKQFLNF